MKGEGFFTESDSVSVVTARNAAASDARLRAVMEVVTRKLHEAVKEIEPSEAEWMAAIQFLTRTGQMCSDWRQEFILLSDVLGVSMLVDAINHRKAAGAGEGAAEDAAGGAGAAGASTAPSAAQASESTVLGPFYVEGAPELPMGADICLDGKGEPMRVSGRILDTEGRPVAGARIDVWQANDEGFYDVQQKGIQPDFNLRGVFRTGADGRYWFRGVRPKHYPIPDDGPVGRLLADLGRHPYRPAHLHYMIQAPGFDRLVTHIFDPDDPYIASDAVFGVKASLLAEFQPNTDPQAAQEAGLPSPFLDVEFDFVLSRPGHRDGATEGTGGLE